jgi:DNA-binding PadR family transcriptional regulator
MKLRRSPQTLQVLSEFLKNPKDWQYGYDISRNTELKSGTLYPILMRMAERGFLETRWETAEHGRPQRHMYRLTSGGVQYAREEMPSTARRSQVQPAFSGVKI